MRLPTTALLATVLCAGCAEPVGHSAFFSSHDAQAHFETVAKSKGLSVIGSTGGSGAGSAGGVKRCRVTIEANRSDRATLMQEYRDFVERELSASGVTIQNNGSSVSGRGAEPMQLSAFHFEYDRFLKPAVKGIFHASSVIDEDGHILVDVVMYEHN